MSKDKHAHDKDHHGHHDHDSHGEHQGPPQDAKAKMIHHDWRFWVAIGLMLLAMVAYVISFDESWWPRSGGKEKPEVPAAGE